MTFKSVSIMSYFHLKYLSFYAFVFAASFIPASNEVLTMSKVSRMQSIFNE